MSNKNTLKRLLGVGAFACCSAILLSVTGQSARSAQVPTVNDLGGMIGGTIRFYQTLNDETEAEIEIPAAVENEAEAEPAEEETIPALPDFTDPDEPVMIPISAVIDDVPNAGITDSLSLASADPASTPLSLATASGAPASDKEDDDWMQAEEAGEAAEKKADDAEKEAPAAEKGSEEKSEEKTDKEESAASGKSEKEDDWMQPEETEDGGEELTAAASVTLSLAIDNRSHTEYLHGYEDGTARPGGPITRAEACQILYNLLGSKPANRASLSDVKADAWYAEPMRLLAAYNIIDCPNDKARPDDHMTRAELVSALSRLVAAKNDGKVSFTDVPASHPYYTAIAKAVGLGWVNGYEDGTFKPDGSITRAEASKVVNRALSRTPDKDWIDKNITEPLYSDLAEDHWAYYELMEASVAHTVSITGGKESWNPGEVAAEEEKSDPAPAEETEKPLAGSETETEEGHEAAQPKSTGWADEELERMLSEPLPEAVDESRLEFDGLELYALDEKGERVKDVTLGRYLTFGKDGRYTTGDKKLDKCVKDLLKEITTDEMTRGEKLKAAFEYCRDHFQYRRRNFYEPAETGWEKAEALTMFETKKGNCYNYAASFAMLARQLGYDAEAVSGLVGSELQPHGWAEIIVDGERLFYDTILEASYLERGYDYDFFGQQYEKAPWPYHKH